MKKNGNSDVEPYRAGQNEAAAEAFETVLRINRYFVPAYVSLSEVHMHLNDEPTARDYLGRAIRLDKHNWSVVGALKLLEQGNN